MEQTNNKTGSSTCASTVMDAPAVSVDHMMQDVLCILINCYDQAPLGTIYASQKINSFLTDVAIDVNADCEHPLMQKVTELRALIGDDSQKKLSEAMADDETKLQLQREAAEVATRVFEHIDAPPFSDANEAVKFNLKWIIGALEADPVTDIGAKEQETVLREAYKLKLTLSGAPDIVSEMRFLISQELLISRVLNCVPATTLYGFWLSLKPTTEECAKYHDLVARQLEALPAESWSLEDHANASITFWASVSETVEHNGRDAIMRILSQQATDYLRERINSLRYHLSRNREPWALPACKRATDILTNMKVKPVFPHAELSVWDLSPESSNFEETQASAAN